MGYYKMDTSVHATKYKLNLFIISHPYLGLLYLTLINLIKTIKMNDRHNELLRIRPEIKKNTAFRSNG